MEEENIPGNQAPTGDANATANESQPAEQTQTQAQAQEAANPTQAEAKTFTQEEVNELIQKRLERDRKSLFKKYGVEDQNGLDDLIGKAQAYDEMKGKMEGIEGERSALSERLAFMTNNANPEKYDDIRAYFKGKGLPLAEGSLAEEMKSHPEWLIHKPEPTTTIKALGAEATAQPKPNEKAQASRLFGVSL